MREEKIFKLEAPYKPTGDQPTAIKELVEGFQSGNQCQTLLGVTGSGKTFTMANVIQQLQKPTLIIAHNKTLAAQLYGEFKELLPVVLRVKSLSAFRRKSMIENKIPFIIEGKQIYLPFMGTFLQAKGDADIKASEKFMVSSQVLFLMYMYQKSEQLYLADAVRALPYSAMTVTRAAKQLEERGFFYVKKEGVNKILFSQYSKKELFERIRES